jgi:hypothetical protein
MFVLFFYECHHLTSWDLYYPTKKWIVQFYGVHPTWQFAGLPKCVCSGWNQLNQCLIFLFAIFRPTVQRKSSGACSDISSKFHRSVGATEQFRLLSIDSKDLKAIQLRMTQSERKIAPVWRKKTQLMILSSWISQYQLDNWQYFHKCKAISDVMHRSSCDQLSFWHSAKWAIVKNVTNENARITDAYYDHYWEDCVAIDDVFNNTEVSCDTNFSRESVFLIQVKWHLINDDNYTWSTLY